LDEALLDSAHAPRLQFPFKAIKYMDNAESCNKDTQGKMKKKAVRSCQKLVTFLDHVSSNPRLHKIQFIISMRRLKKMQMEKLAFLATSTSSVFMAL
jgi:hypothetical protein